MHPNSRLLFRKYALPYFGPGTSVLEIGPNGFPSTYQQQLGPVARWDTLDIFPDERLTFSQSPPYEFPIRSGSYDVVLAGNVLEHVPRVWVWVKELARVCKSGGVVITVNPLSWPYHEAPIDCWRVYPEGMKALYADSGLDVLHSSYESLEATEYRRTIPFMTFTEYLARRPWPVRVLYRVATALGFPAMAAYDTITIGRKQTPSEPSS